MGARNINAIHNDMNQENINNIIDINEGEENQNHVIPIEEQNHIVQERTTSKKVLAVRLPTNLNKKTLSLEYDSINIDKCYLKFNYDSLFDIDCYINFNVIEKSELSSKNKNHMLSYSPSKNLADKEIYFNGLKSGENIEFFDKNSFIDIRNFLNNKSENQNSFDVCIEFVPLFPPGSPEIEDNNEIIFVTLCNFEKHQDENNYIIKCMKQRLLTHKTWIDLYDIFDSALEGGLCIICYSEKRNTIFLPCKHACCCNKCGSEIKYRFKPCPICKTPIDDLLIITSDEKKIKKEKEDEENLDISDNIDSNATDSNIIINTSSSNNKINDSNTISENINEDDALLPFINKNSNIINEKNDKNKNENNNILNIDIENNIDSIDNINIENDYIKIEDKDDKEDKDNKDE